MRRILQSLVVALAAFGLAAGSALAQKAEPSKDAAKKSATTHLDMSKAEMKKGNEAGCMEHMAQAHKAMGM